MSYLDLINKIYDEDQLQRDDFLSEMKKLGMHVKDFDDINKIKEYPDEYVELVNQSIEKFKHFGTIDFIIYSLGVYKNNRAFEWLSKTWLELIESSLIYNSNAKAYYDMFENFTGRKLSDSVDEYISRIKEHAVWIIFQVISLTASKRKMKELYDLTNKYNISRVTEALIVLSKNGFYNEIVTRIIDELCPLINNDMKCKNVFLYLSKHIVSEKFIPYLELLSSDKNKELSSQSIKLLKSKRYQKLLQ